MHSEGSTEASINPSNLDLEGVWTLGQTLSGKYLKAPFTALSKEKKGRDSSPFESELEQEGGRAVEATGLGIG